MIEFRFSLFGFPIAQALNKVRSGYAKGAQSVKVRKSAHPGA